MRVMLVRRAGFEAMVPAGKGWGDGIRNPGRRSVGCADARAAGTASARHVRNLAARAVFALDLSGLQDPAVTMWGAWDGETLAAIGALKMLGQDSAEVKSMRTHPDFLRRGAAAALLDHVIATADARGIRRLSLETGRGPAFEPALAMYRRRGFADGGPFSDYLPNAFSQFLHLTL
jgi:putative acetyltransferase